MKKHIVKNLKVMLFDPARGEWVELGGISAEVADGIPRYVFDEIRQEWVRIHPAALTPAPTMCSD